MATFQSISVSEITLGIRGRRAMRRPCVGDPDMAERQSAISLVRSDSSNDLQWWTIAKEQAAMLVKTGFLPNSIKTVEQCVAIMLKGRELSVPAMYALSNIAVINGKPTCGAELMLALVHRDHGRDAIRVKHSTAESCTVEWKEWGGVNSFTFTIEDAKRAGLANKEGPWRQYPAAMLRARAISAACRMAFPGSIAGMYTPEELGAVVTVRDDGSVDVVEDDRHAAYLANAKPAEPTPINPTMTSAPNQPETPSRRQPIGGWSEFWPWAKQHGVKNEEDFIALVNRRPKDLTPQEARELVEAAMEELSRAVAARENGEIEDGDFVDVAMFATNSPDRFTR
jgi:hypothetical protein